MIFASVNGTRRSIGRDLTTDTDTEIVESVPAGQKVTVDSIWIACDGTGTAIDLWWSNGTTDFSLYVAKPVPANDRIFVEDFHLVLREGCSLLCKAAVANHLTLTAIVIDGSSNKGGNSQ